MASESDEGITYWATFHKLTVETLLLSVGAFCVNVCE